MHTQPQVTNPVLPGGSKVSNVMVVGDAPGFFEDLYNQPFVSKSGILLKQCLHRVGLDTPYFTNVVKCRPVPDQEPDYLAVETCASWLAKEIDLIKPKVIITVGALASRLFLTNKNFGVHLKDFKVSKYRGKVYDTRGAYVVPTWHPGYVIRNRSAAFDLIQDLKLARGIINKIK